MFPAEILVTFGIREILRHFCRPMSLNWPFDNLPTGKGFFSLEISGTYRLNDAGRKSICSGYCVLLGKAYRLVTVHVKVYVKRSGDLFQESTVIRGDFERFDNPWWALWSSYPLHWCFG